LKYWHALHFAIQSAKKKKVIFVWSCVVAAKTVCRRIRFKHNNNNLQRHFARRKKPQHSSLHRKKKEIHANNNTEDTLEWSTTAQRGENESKG